jgi:hypothetical protein
MNHRVRTGMVTWFVAVTSTAVDDPFLCGA